MPVLGFAMAEKVGSFAIISIPTPAGAHRAGSSIPVGDELGLETVAYCPSHLTPVSAEVEHSLCAASLPNGIVISSVNLTSIMRAGSSLTFHMPSRPDVLLL